MRIDYHKLVRAAPDRQLRSELADVLEVLRALAAVYGMSWEDVEAKQRASAAALTSGFSSNTSIRSAEYRAMR